MPGVQKGEEEVEHERVTNPLSSGDLLFAPRKHPEEMARPGRDDCLAFLENFLWVQKQRASALSRQKKIPSNDHTSYGSLETGGP